jgi:hypothetical protein
MIQKLLLLITEIFQIVRSEHMAAEGDPVAEKCTN